MLLTCIKERTQGVLVKDILKIDNFSVVCLKVEIVNDQVGLLAKDRASVRPETLDIKNVRGQLALPLPLMSIRTEDSCNRLGIKKR